MLTYVSKRVAALPAGISADVISGHAHTVENERTLRRDLRLMVVLAGAGFLGLFLFCFRDVRAVAVFLIPMIAVLIAMAGVAVATGGLSALVVGIGSVGAGISVDYGCSGNKPCVDYFMALILYVPAGPGSQHPGCIT